MDVEYLLYNTMQDVIIIMMMMLRPLRPASVSAASDDSRRVPGADS